MTAYELEGLSKSARRIAEQAQRLGLSIIREGRVWRIFGNGIDIRTTRLDFVRPDELRPDR